MTVQTYTNPLIIQLEPTTACNLECPFCMRRKFNRSEGFISFFEFQRIIDASRCRILTLHGWGEPLLHQDLPDMIRYAAEKKISVNFTTNGTQLPGKTASLLDSGLDAIAFSFPESTQFTPIIRHNVAGFIRERSFRGRKLPKTYLNIALMEENFDCIDEGLALASEIGIDMVTFERSFPWTENQVRKEKSLFAYIKNAAKKTGCKVNLPVPHSVPCPLFQLTLFVRWNGDVAPCCYRADFPLGNLLREDLTTIMRRRNAFSRLMKMDSVCRDCRI